MTEDILTAILIIVFAVVVYVAGKGNLIELIPLMLLEKAEELKEIGCWTEECLRVPGDETAIRSVYICSECCKFNQDKTDFCPNCGAKMNTEKENKNAY